MKTASTIPSAVPRRRFTDLVPHLSLLFLVASAPTWPFARIPECEVVVDVVEPDVEVWLGRDCRRVDGRRFAPLVLQTPEGPSELLVTRGPTILHREAFYARQGFPLRLTAWDSRDAK